MPLSSRRRRRRQGPQVVGSTRRRHHDTEVIPRVSPAANPSPAAEGAVSRTFKLITEVVGPSTLVVALLYYFGWVRTRAFYQYFGVDVDVLRLSSAGYISRSAEAVWPVALGLG